jgi:hypothetical protein
MRQIAAVTCVLFSLAGAVPQRPVAQTRSTAKPIFLFHADELWLNLHHFLYVLGRDEAQMRDRTRRAVARAPADAENGMAALTPEEQQAWKQAVSFYAKGPSRHDAVFDEPAIATVASLARAGSSQSLDGTGLDERTAATLERAAPLYRKAWWPAHEAANRTWVTEARKVLAEHGDSVLEYITRAYGLEWPPSGYPVHVSAYANWAGAYSTRADILVISSLDPLTSPLDRLEVAFHEAMHQWDPGVRDLLRTQANAQGTRFPPQLSHALIFYTAGEAIRSISGTHVSYADRNGIWERGMTAFKADLDAVWKPYLDGKGTRDEALAELIRRSASHPGR